MCDTQVLLNDQGTYFAKNSDREPSEPHLVQRFDAVQGDSATKLRTTYLEIDQVPDRQAVILCKPNWIWGAEMGINAAGVMIGNEAIFSREVSREPALLGMDLVRLGLERADSAEQALQVIVDLLERYGQGGAAGFRDKGFCYDNSFIIADQRQAWVLETAANTQAEIDPQRITQAIVALADNAVRYTRPGDRIALGSQWAGGNLRFWVADTGPGVGEADRARIFERFARGTSTGPRSEGAGLGLAIIRAIAVAHGGRVLLDSIPGRGATFTVVIPAVVPEELHP